MRRSTLLSTVVGFAIPLLTAVSANAQATRTWVSGVGDDANPCSRTAPCKTFAGAISKTAAGGEINCLDPGGFGGVTITKSITISCEAGTAGVLVSGTNAIIVNAAASDRVFLKGLDIEGLITGLNGINVLSAALVHVEDCVIRNFQGANPNGFGIKLTPSAGLTFIVARTTLYNNGTAAFGGGVQVRPTGGFTSGTLDKVIAVRNGSGITGDGNGGGSFNFTVRDSTLSGNVTDGIFNTTAGTGIVNVERSSIVNNSTNGLRTTSAAIIRVGSSSISGNTTATSGAGVQSYGNNQINGNGTDTIPGGVPGGLH